MKVLDDVVRNVPEKYKADVRQIFLDDEPSSAVLAGLVLPWTSLAVPRGLIENPAEQHSRYHTSQGPTRTSFGQLLFPGAICIRRQILSLHDNHLLPFIMGLFQKFRSGRQSELSILLGMSFAQSLKLNPPVEMLTIASRFRMFSILSMVQFCFLSPTSVIVSDCIGIRDFSFGDSSLPFVRFALEDFI